MKTDKFMQGILVDDDDIFSYADHPRPHPLSMVVIRLKSIKKNFKDLKSHIPYTETSENNQAIFSKNNTSGRVDDAITEVLERLKTRI